MIKSKSIKGYFASIFPALIVLAGCESIDCTLENEVMMYATLVQDGKPVSLNDTLTVTGGKSGILLLNKISNVSKVTLPLSYYFDTDTLVFTVKGEDYELQDTVWVSKSNTPHYESPDCPNTMFHLITDVKCTHEFIEKVTITGNIVSYAKGENLQICLYPAN